MPSRASAKRSARTAYRWWATAIFWNYFYGPLTDNLWRLSLGLGYRFSDRLVLKAEYSFERGTEVGGDSRNKEDFFGTEAAFKF